MKQPCMKDCPDRAPGCCCEKRRDWLREHRDRKKKERAEKEIAAYQASARRDSANPDKQRRSWRHE